MVAQEVVPSGHTRLAEGGVAPVKYYPLHRPVLIQFAVLEKKVEHIRMAIFMGVYHYNCFLWGQHHNKRIAQLLRHVPIL